jgi:casein kinase II subunit beta
MPEKTQARHEPRVFGFRVHACAALARWQDRQRDDMKARLKQFGLESPFVEDQESEEESDDVDVEDSEVGSLSRPSRMAVDGQDNGEL